ncbi:MAG: dTDP-4-dehydrorhamnose 3,5-epimerase [Thermodesulfovibrio sp.]|jgi:dTDP-4-dehydrorhamnose 3,5-epimerase|uniref:dTDP-4-dehydrorhamnose 3,5-epimerase n=1 Tax=Thermodesulfovibrio sp. 1176 TaxID=3043424 RepID=UPI0024832030|nr:dTDP-4-dehydrorhamnose 3,5-epimerase [Thermodesulfovibrio sp. 1176]MDI1471629.1 dTDP-4-dehydrorhamnose 3,5-epimerase [Thermodesulfovibrio sp. 1176]MDI6714300.1 dTDP-4-dehydrorhamnose 3,5-epimerase [Thermodesulfovibrio sp.]
MPFDFFKLEIPDVLLIKPKVFEDERGFFLEIYKASEFAKAGIDLPFYQVNHSKSKKGVLRGLHFQLEPKAQGKLVWCIKGKIWDVAVDLRKGSPWFSKWVAVELSEKNKHLLWIPPGFAHGFVALEDCEIIYLTTNEYAPELDRGIIWNDPTLNISWPVREPLLSHKDSTLPRLEDAEMNFYYRSGK